MTDLHITTHVDGPITIVELAGDLNLATAPDLATHLGTLLAESHRLLIVDLTRLGCCDAAGVHSLCGGVMRARSVGGVLCLVHPDERFVCRVDPTVHLEIQSSVASALADLMPGLTDPPTRAAPLPGGRRFGGDGGPADSLPSAVAGNA